MSFFLKTFAIGSILLGLSYKSCLARAEQPREPSATQNSEAEVTSVPIDLPPSWTPISKLPEDFQNKALQTTNSLRNLSFYLPGKECGLTFLETLHKTKLDRTILSRELIRHWKDMGIKAEVTDGAATKPQHTTYSLTWEFAASGSVGVVDGPFKGVAAMQETSTGSLALLSCYWSQDFDEICRQSCQDVIGEIAQ